jgi:hypothetical protein
MMELWEVLASMIIGGGLVAFGYVLGRKSK